MEPSPSPDLQHRSTERWLSSTHLWRTVSHFLWVPLCSWLSVRPLGKYDEPRTKLCLGKFHNLYFYSFFNVFNTSESSTLIRFPTLKCGIRCLRIWNLIHCGSIFKISEISFVVNSVILWFSFSYINCILFSFFISFLFRSFSFRFSLDFVYGYTFSFWFPLLGGYVVLSTRDSGTRVHPTKKYKREHVFRCNHTTEDSTSLDSYRVQGVSPQEREYLGHHIEESLVPRLCLYPMSPLIKQWWGSSSFYFHFPLGLTTWGLTLRILGCIHQLVSRGSSLEE